MEANTLQETQGAPSARQLILQVRWGPMAYRKVLLSPGQVLQVGRDQAMGLSLLHDTEMSNAHFELSWDGEKCRLRDLKSTTGTLLGGTRVEESLIQHGDWIRAGSTDFSVYVEGASPLPPASEPANSRRTEALRMLGEQESLFAVLDAARNGRILELLQQSTEEYRSLYEGPQGEALAEVAPYLVQLPRGSKLLEHLVLEGWGDAWGSYFTCDLPFLETRRHLRKFLMVEAEGQEARLYMRFYDPRVLGTLLPTFPPEQRRAFYGPIHQFIYEDPEGLLLKDSLLDA